MNIVNSEFFPMYYHRKFDFGYLSLRVGQIVVFQTDYDKIEHLKNHS